MPTFVDSTSQATRHAVYAIERNPPTVIQAQNVSVAAIVEQFPWGPEGENQIAGVKDFIDTYAPGGMSRTGAGYMSVIGKAWPILKVVRVLGSGAAAASVTLQKTGPADMLTLALKYKGAAGNSVTATVQAATDGDSNHFDLIVSITSATGTTQDIFRNLNYSGTGSDSTPDLTQTKLLGSITKTSSGSPLTGTFSFATGSDGTVASSDYVGTQGAADHGIALLEGDKTVDFVFVGDPGNSLRAAVNTGLQAHADYMTDRIAFINGNSAQALSAAQTDVANYRSLRCCYIDVWAYQRDDVDGTEHLVSPAPFAASVAANLSPSTSFSWKSSVVKKFLSAITRLEAARGDGAYTNELAGICTLQKEDNGGFSFEAAVVTNAPINPTKKKYKRTRMGHYMAKAVVQSLRESVDSPNVPFNQIDEVTAVSTFIAELKGNATIDPNNLPHLLDGGIDDLPAFNAQSDLDAGQFTIPISAKISSDQERIFLSMNFGESVRVQTSL